MKKQIISGVPCAHDGSVASADNGVGGRTRRCFRRTGRG